MLNRQHCLRLCTIAAISGALFSAQAIAAEQWVKVLTNDRGVWFVDKSSIAPQGKNLAFWAYIVHDTPTRINNMAIQTEGDYVLVDCRSRRYRLVYKRLMDKNNQLVHELDFSRRHGFGSPRKGSGEAVSINFVCSQ
jgi:hypothetical protein